MEFNMKLNIKASLMLAMVAMFSLCLSEQSLAVGRGNVRVQGTKHCHIVVTPNNVIFDIIGDIAGPYQQQAVTVQSNCGYGLYVESAQAGGFVGGAPVLVGQPPLAGANFPVTFDISRANHGGTSVATTGFVNIPNASFAGAGAGALIDEVAVAVAGVAYHPVMPGYAAGPAVLGAAIAVAAGGAAAALSRTGISYDLSVNYTAADATAALAGVYIHDLTFIAHERR